MGQLTGDILFRPLSSTGALRNHCCVDWWACSRLVCRNRREALVNNLEEDQKRSRGESRGGWRDEPLQPGLLTRRRLVEMIVFIDSI